MKKILLTNDLTEPVLSEAVEEKVDLVISYHPPLFRPFKRLTKGNWKERVKGKTTLRVLCKYISHVIRKRNAQIKAKQLYVGGSSLC